VSDRLEQHPDIDASDIEVQVRDGAVTLTGSVEARYVKRMAEDVCESVSGVKEVVNQLRVAPPTEATIAGSASSREAGGTSAGSTGSTGAGTRTRR
jgi:hypothetical protein